MVSKKVALAGALAAGLAVSAGEAQAQVMVQTQVVGVQPIMGGPVQGMPMQAPGGVFFRNMAGQVEPVEIPGAGGCMMPCTLPLAPGNYLMSIGGGRFQRPITVPMVPSAVDYYPRNVGGIVSGSIMLAAGGIVGLAGIGVLGYGAWWLSSYTLGSTIVGYTIVAAGVVLLAVGLPIAIVGGLRIARSAPAVVVRPGMMGSRERPQRSPLALTTGYQQDTYNGGVISTIGLSF